MRLSALIAQFPISLSIQENLASIQEALESTRPGDLVLFPEGALSGYALELSFLNGLDLTTLKDGLEALRLEAIERQIHLWVGACIFEHGEWRNTAFGFTPQGEQLRYDKINLAHHERGIFTPGSSLPVFQLETTRGELTIGVQICRELRYPEQWGWLARQGSQVFLHLNNAIGAESFRPVWRSHLVSRAAETQRYVLSANNAAIQQTSPSLAIHPKGHILGEMVSDQRAILRVELDTSQTGELYLDQCRRDVVVIKPA